MVKYILYSLINIMNEIGISMISDIFRLFILRYLIQRQRKEGELELGGYPSKTNYCLLTDI